MVYAVVLECFCFFKTSDPICNSSISSLEVPGPVDGEAESLFIRKMNSCLSFKNPEQLKRMWPIDSVQPRLQFRVVSEHIS